MNRGGRLPATVTSSTAATGTIPFAGAMPSGFGGARSQPAHFLNFGSVGALESTPHNVVHGVLGGGVDGPACRTRWMGKPQCAALDPIFWLHHAQIDRLWNRWLSLGGGRAHPSDADWQSGRFTFHDETGTQVTRLVSDVLNSETQLRYRYDDQPSFTPPVAPVTPPPSPARLVAATEQPFDLVGAPALVNMAVPAEGAEALVTDVINGTSRAVLNVEDIGPDSDSTVPYAVYVVLPGGERRHIGNVSLFGIEAMRDLDQPHEGATGFRHSFDVTDLVNELGDPANLGAGQVTLEFAPLEPEAPLDGEGSGGVVVGGGGEAREETPTLNVGRVSLFVS
jgi:tyrosinase